MTDIQDALSQFNLADFHDELDAGERERSEMVARFPLTSRENMSLEQYALGQSRPKEDVYCWWLEFGTPHLGNIGGSTAIKHMIYYHSNGYWKYLREYTDENKAWQAAHTEFLRMFELAEAGQWDQIDDETLFRRGSRAKLKSLHIYYPENILPIVSPQHMRDFLLALARQCAVIPLERGIVGAAHWQIQRPADRLYRALLLQRLHHVPFFRHAGFQTRSERVRKSDPAICSTASR